MTELENIFNFFSERRIKFLKIRVIERESGIPDRTLDNFLKQRQYRSLTPEQIDKLVPILVEFGFKPIGKLSL